MSCPRCSDARSAACGVCVVCVLCVCVCVCVFVCMSSLCQDAYMCTYTCIQNARAAACVCVWVHYAKMSTGASCNMPSRRAYSMLSRRCTCIRDAPSACTCSNSAAAASAAAASACDTRTSPCHTPRSETPLLLRNPHMSPSAQAWTLGRKAATPRPRPPLSTAALHAREHDSAGARRVQYLQRLQRTPRSRDGLV